MSFLSSIAHFFGFGKDSEGHDANGSETMPTIYQDTLDVESLSGMPLGGVSYGGNGEGPHMSWNDTMRNSTINQAYADQFQIPGQVNQQKRIPQRPGPQQFAPGYPQQPYPQQGYPQQPQPVPPPQAFQYAQPQQPMQQPQARPQPPMQPVVQQAQMEPPMEQMMGDPSCEPFYEMILSNNTYHFFVDLPGVDKQSVDVQYINGTVKISGVRELQSVKMKKASKGDKGKRPVFESRVTVPKYLSGKFEFSFDFPLPIEEGSLTASFKDGVLHVKMDLRASTSGIKVAIQ